MTPAGRIFFETHVAPLLATEGLARQVAIDLKCSDGHRMPVLSDWRSVVRDGRTIGIRAMFVDATDRRAYERDLLAARERAEETAARLTASEAELRELNETLERRVAERTADLERAHEQLRQSQKLEAMGSLTGGVAHDFNNLLTPILGLLDTLQRHHISDNRERQAIAGALASAERAKTLVQRLLAFARRQPLQARAIDVGDLVGGMAELVASTSGPRIQVLVERDPALPHALADANQIEMAVLNLAVNARDAMPAGGTLTLGVYAEESGSGMIRLVVADTGMGMDRTTLERAVEPFFSTKGIGKGTGLGLSMVHGLAAQLGGNLTLHSEPGRGTTVELRLPAVDRPTPVLPALTEAAVRCGAPGSALLVDDEKLVRFATAFMLKDLGFTVVEADSAEAAIRMLEDGLRPNIVVSDHLMPGMNGTELAFKVQEWLGIPTLIVSGYADVEGVAAGLPRLSKPFRRKHLAEALERMSGINLAA
jgi:signal transduction histidine kinase